VLIIRNLACVWDYGSVCVRVCVCVCVCVLWFPQRPQSIAILNLHWKGFFSTGVTAGLVLMLHLKRLMQKPQWPLLERKLQKARTSQVCATHTQIFMGTGTLWPLSFSWSMGLLYLGFPGSCFALFQRSGPGTSCQFCTLKLHYRYWNMYEEMTKIDLSVEDWDVSICYNGTEKN
jgi:hypothetical protein